MSIKAGEHPGISREPFVTPVTETIALTVTETTVHRRTLTVTPALLDEAEAEGYERNVYGVANMLDDSDGDHWEVVNTVQPAYFDSVTERSASTEVP